MIDDENFMESLQPIVEAFQPIIEAIDSFARSFASAVESLGGMFSLKSWILSHSSASKRVKYLAIHGKSHRVRNKNWNRVCKEYKIER